MSIDMYLERSRNQATSVSALSKNINQGYGGLQEAVTQFVNEDTLKGKAYNSGKQFFSVVVVPLITSMKTLSDLTEEACETFVERYTSEVDSQSLKESELEEDIQELKLRITQLEDLNVGLKKHASNNRDAI